MYFRLIPIIFAILISVGAQAQSGQGNPPGSISQTIHKLKISYFAIEGAGAGTVTIVLKFENTHTGNQIAFAAKAANSDGIADFWKFFPTAIAKLTDNLGREYSLVRSSGMGMARDKNDWTIVNSGGSVPASFTFSGPAGGTSYNFSTEVRIAWGDENNQPATGSFQVYFPDLRR